MIKTIKKFIAFIFIVGCMGSSTLYTEPFIPNQYDLNGEGDDFISSIRYLFIEKTMDFWTNIKKINNNRVQSIDNWSNTLKKILSHHNDPRLLAIVISLGIVTIGGVYMLARKKSKVYEKIIGASCILFGIANIIISSNWIRLADSYGRNIGINQ